MKFSETMTEEIKNKIRQIEDQLEDLKSLKEEKLRLQKILKLIDKDKNKKPSSSLSKNVQDILDILKNNDRIMTTKEIMTHLIEKKGLQEAPSLEYLRSALHKLKISNHIITVSWGHWQYVPKIMAETLKPVDMPISEQSETFFNLQGMTLMAGPR